MKNLKNLGQALSKAEQKEVNGGRLPQTISLGVCYPEFRPTIFSCEEGFVPFINDEGIGFCCEGN
jgi:hypothetical protein